MADYRAFKDSWSVNSFKKRFEKGEINFDNPIQRGIVWNKVMSSLYIHSLLYDVLVYQKPFLISKKRKWLGRTRWKAKRNEPDKIYKQRICSYRVTERAINNSSWRTL